MTHRHGGRRTDVMIRGSLSRQARIDYTNAVKCLYRKPNLSSLLDVPGARNRYDDFVATHIMHTPKVHYSVCIFFLLHLGPIGGRRPTESFKRVYFSSSIAT